MNAPRLDSLVRSLGEAPSRRGLLTGLSATALALAATRLPIAVEAKKAKKKKHKKKKHKKQSATPQTPATPVTKADAVCPGPTNDAYAIGGVDWRLAQTFTALTSGSLVKAELLLSEPAGSLGDYVLRIAPADGAGIPTNIILAETAVLDIDVPNGKSTVSFTFANPASVVAGNSYALVLTRAGSDKLVWLGHIGNSCTGTTYFSESQFGQFVAVGNIDLIFETFVNS
jgi:hypothetical protein